MNTPTLTPSSLLSEFGKPAKQSGGKHLTKREITIQEHAHSSPLLSEFGRAALLRFHKVYGKLPTSRAEALEFLRWEKGMGKERKMI